MAKRMLMWFFVVVSVLFTTTIYAGSAVDMEEGMWEITTKVKMQGMEIPPQTFSQCITKKDMVPQNNDPSQQGNCTVSDVQTSGNTVSWTMVCKTEGGEMKSKGKITYHGDSFTGESTSEMMGMVIVTEMSGKRTGPCQ
ncbi:lipoprotein [Desulfosarcina widdelii]|uniref:Lipoprotein n=1 Tax=Desulfosarcina widdelii TaxID=947919 RepID=A0A5K7Z6L2_9BACT|nr:DUF3617 family protein [Desulfosarcina widdelii]BBO74094.1 lipoprotein [Desulfosarcina widdelii]